MKKLTLLLLLCLAASGQGILLPILSGSGAAAAGGTWSLSELKSHGNGGASCATVPTTDCSVTITSLPANAYLLVGTLTAGNHTLASVTDSAANGNWTLCGASCRLSSSSGTVDMASNISTTAGTTTVTCHIDSAEGSYYECLVAVFTCSGCTGIAVDGKGTANPTTCTSCAGPALSPFTGSSEAALVIFGADNNATGASPSPWTFDATTAIGVTAVGLTTGSAPTLTQDVSGGMIAAGMSLKKN